MTVWEYGYQILYLLNMSVVYYAMQLVRCAFFSYAVLVCIYFLRRTVFKNNIFLKGAAWGLLIPVLFVGRMKFFYENKAGRALFSWWTAVSMSWSWLCWFYLGGVFIFTFFLWRKRRRIKKLTEGMEKRMVEGTLLYVTDIPVTPFAAGVFRPKIVVPGVILKEYGEEEQKTILLHEKVHIQLGHLLLYLLWDMLRALLWINPLLTVGMKYFREDMEEICDRVTIQRSGGDACAYGMLLLKSMKVLHAESEAYNMYVAFAGDKAYQNLRQRITRIAGYRPYKRRMAFAILAVSVLCIAGTVGWIENNSYARYSEDEGVLVYGYKEGEVSFLDTSDTLCQMISYDDSAVYVNREAFESFLCKNNVKGDIFIVFGGYSKLPGFGGGGYSCFYEPDGENEIVTIPYERRRDDWMMVWFKML